MRLTCMALLVAATFQQGVSGVRLRSKGRPSAQAAAAGGGAPKTFLLKDVLAAGSSAGSLQDGGTLAVVVTSTWFDFLSDNVAEGIRQVYSASSSGTLPTTPEFIQPNSAPTGGVNGARDSWRSENTLTGTFAAGTWQIQVDAQVGGLAPDGNTLGMCVRLWKSVNANGTTATELTSGPLCNSGFNDFGPTFTASSALGAFTFAGEYLFLQVAMTSDGIGSGVEEVTEITVGTAHSFVTTPTFQ